MIYLGCSGWSYDEWVGPFYKSARQDKLVQYSQTFNTVEINSTFYRTPPEEMVKGWVKKVSGKPGFRFTVKLPKDLSHDLILHSSKSSAYFMESFESQVLAELNRSGLAGSLLLQLPPFFTDKHLPILKEFFQSVDTRKYRYAVEFRHRYFYGNSEVDRDLAELGAGVVWIDSPEYEIRKVDSDLEWAYLRFHGRNSQDWFKRSETMVRYRYDYTEKELNGLASIVQQSRDRYKDIYIYFNNHPDGNAARNGISLSRILGIQASQEKRSITDY